MTIGFDLDGILINTPPLVPAWIIDRFYKEKDNTTLQYRIPGTIEKYIRQLSHTPFLRPPMKNNLLFLKQLSKHNKHNLYLVSSRFDFLSQHTETLCNKYKFKRIFKDTYFNYLNEQPHLFKESVLKKLKLDIFIDDDLSLLLYLSKKNPGGKFYWHSNFSTSLKLPENIKMIKTLSEIDKYVKIT